VALILTVESCTQCLFHVFHRQTSGVSSGGQIGAVNHNQLVLVLLFISHNGILHVKMRSWIKNVYSAHFSF
jgi:hypothetical protein